MIQRTRNHRVISCRPLTQVRGIDCVCVNVRGGWEEEGGGACGTTCKCKTTIRAAALSDEEEEEEEDAG